MAIGFMTIAFGLPALIQACLSFWLLFAHARWTQNTAVIMLGVVPAIFFLAQPLVSLIIIVVTVAVLTAVKSRKNR